MSFKILPKHLFKTWVERLRATHRVVAPKEVYGQYIFDEIHSADEIVLDYHTSVLPPKKYLLPPREELFDFNAKTMEMRPLIEEIQPTVIFALHTCDMHAMTILDKIHDTGYADQHYQARRRKTTLVSIECLTPCMEHAFCKSMGTLSVPDSFDIHLTDLGDRYAVDVGSEQGEALVEGMTFFWQATETDYDKVNEVMATKWPSFQYRLDFDVTELPDLLAVSLKSPVWDELGDICLACGQCTKVCPTCYCFDVVDEVDLRLEHGKRIRVWDSCLIEKFAVVAGGHNFRSSRARRLRHRFNRKGKFQQEAYGLLGCVGCGRCALSCPVHITPVDTFNRLNARRQRAQEGQARSS
ncbi:MAG: 4Fe-4S dicluster domain-containing protein [Anaerolinea sp.]|nr:4Fe-4S dicluster domain-containing protein [Anaerolinea sp.]